MGEVPRTTLPEPVTAAARAVATPVPKPDTPVEIGSPVALVSVPLDGVPSAPPLVTNAPADPTATPNAVTTFAPVVIVEGAAPAPPPTIMALAAKTADEAHAAELLKYGTPPEVPATVSANVPEAVIGEPETEIKPPVNDCATLVTVPVPVTVVHVGAPAPPDVSTCPDVPAAEYASVVPVP